MMGMQVAVRNESRHKHLYRRDVLQRIADRVYDGEGLAGDVEVSVLFCDDDVIRDLNARYRNKMTPTDVLSFEQPRSDAGPVGILGDVVISLDTARRNCRRDRARTRKEVRLLFCHGLLHLLGYTHDTVRDRNRMIEKQALYLRTREDEAWRGRTSVKTG